MAWNPFEFDNFDIDNLASVSTDNTFDNAIGTSEFLADDDSDLDLFKSYQITKEGADCDDCSVFKELDELLDDEDDIQEDNMEVPKDHLKESSVWAAFSENEILAFDDSEDIEEHCGECDEEDKSSLFDECDSILAGLAEAVLDDGEDDSITDSVDDMPDDDDAEDDLEGVDEIEADIIDDEEDDLIDMAMDVEE